MFGTKNFVSDYGGVADGTTNNDTAFYSAGLSGTTVLFPPGTYCFTSFSIVASNTKFQGSGQGLTILKSTTTGGQIIIGSTSAAYSAMGLYDMTLSKTVDASGAAFVACYNSWGTEFFNLGASINNGIVFDIGGGSNNFKTMIKNVCVTSAKTGIQIGVNNGQTQDTWISDCLLGSCTTAGIVAKYVGGLYINDVDIISCGTAVSISPGSGQDFKAGMVKGLLCDTATSNGLVIAPTGTGIVANSNFCNSWAATTQAAAGAGVVIGGGGGTVSNLNFDTFICANNKGVGFSVLSGASNLTLSNLTCSANSQATANTYDGLNIASTATNVLVVGGTFGGSDGFTQQQRYGIYNASTSTKIRNVNCVNNTTAKIYDSSGSLL